MLKVQSRMYRVRIMRENRYSEIHSKSFLEGHVPTIIFVLVKFYCDNCPFDCTIWNQSHLFIFSI